VKKRLPIRTKTAIDYPRKISMTHTHNGPIVDADFGVVKELKEQIAPLPEADQRKVLGENAVRFYGLKEVGP
jgi:hypothetical protein